MYKLKIPLKDQKAFRNVLVLANAQALVGAQLPMHFILGGLAGLYLSPNACFATLPITMIIIGSTLSSPFLSMFMQKFGRRLGFVVGCLFGGLGAAISSLAIYFNSFTIFVIGTFITGVYMSSYSFYRFAATDTARITFRPKAISYVVAAGLISAILGPQLVKISSNFSPVPFLGSYMVIILLNLIGPFIFVFLDIPITKNFSKDLNLGNNQTPLLKNNMIRLAIFCGMISYGLMNLMMTAAPLAVIGCGLSKNNAADVVMAHVLAMAMPSFFTGHLILKYGTRTIIVVGMIFLFLAAIVGLTGVGLANFVIALIFLGIGWNFSFIGSTTMLANSHQPSERGKIQGINDMFVFGFVALASLASGGLMNCAGGDTNIGWQLVSIAMFPLLAVASLALFTLRFDTTTTK